MSDLTRYRIVTEYEWDASIVRAVDDAITRGTLIPDTTLQDIADAWNLFTHTQWNADICTFNPQLGKLLNGLVNNESEGVDV